MALDDFEELLADKPATRSGAAGGRVVRMMVGARWEHNRIVGNVYSALLTGLRTKARIAAPLAKPSGSRTACLISPVSPT